MKKFLCLVIALQWPLVTLHAQEKSNEERERAKERDMIDFLRGAPLTVNLNYIDITEEEEEENVYVRKKREKKRVFYGEKTKRGFTRSGYRGNRTEELFHYLKKRDHGPDPYLRDFYWIDFKTKQIKNSKAYNKKYGGVLHGPYKKIKDGQVLVEGMYYYGVKHGRWVYYDRNDVLIAKEKYYKGWPRDSEITYYDKDRKMVKEVIPIEYGVREGYYYHFYENGALAVSGEYKYGVKVGQWIEYYPDRRRRKKTIQYTPDPFDRTFVPFISKEWDSNGRLVYDVEQRNNRLRQAGYLSAR
jgi:antitoxin component YwqK of YwqJK toxin-antitoxin module